MPRSGDDVHIYMIRSQLETYQTLLRQLQPLALDAPSGDSPDLALRMFHIICVPSCYAYFHALLEQAGLWGLVQLHHYNWDFIYLDHGVLSLELPNVSNYELLCLQYKYDSHAILISSTSLSICKETPQLCLQWLKVCVYCE